MEKPIIFSTEMVRAILEGRKTQTREIMKTIPGNIRYEKSRNAWIEIGNDDTFHFEHKCPYGTPGDRLWVWESFCLADANAYTSAKKINPDNPDEAAFFKEDWWREKSHPKWKLSMFRWVSRIMLEILNVRPERLQEISAKDVKREGIITSCPECDFGYEPSVCTCIDEFARMWDSINKKRGYGWELNPWVWRIDFRRVE